MNPQPSGRPADSSLDHFDPSDPDFSSGPVDQVEGSLSLSSDSLKPSSNPTFSNELDPLISNNTPFASFAGDSTVSAKSTSPSQAPPQTSTSSNASLDHSSPIESSQRRAGPADCTALANKSSNPAYSTRTVSGTTTHTERLVPASVVSSSNPGSRYQQFGPLIPSGCLDCTHRRHTLLQCRKARVPIRGYRTGAYLPCLNCGEHGHSVFGCLFGCSGSYNHLALYC
ncbi:hypothetical protein N431DRAFT_180204 [Stipitochalara longipes BDJ]|nr:hypothetical protein N431DRAFT_180204 [Stipitochalara longipes BDJ]